MNKCIFYFILLVLVFIISGCTINDHSLEKSLQESMRGRMGTIVLINLNKDEYIVTDSLKAEEKFPPCSTFKIWNALIGSECGVFSSPDEKFYTWDGEARSIPEWNRDLTFKEAFQVSCVPAFQNLAVKIGKDSMQSWLDKISYGDMNISSGIDIFWLPREGKKPLLISPYEQALLIKQLVTNKLSFSDRSKNMVQECMLERKTDRGSFYGKTGSGNNINDVKDSNIGWYVGYVKSKKNSYAFACILQGSAVSGKEARAIIEDILLKNRLI